MHPCSLAVVAACLTALCKALSLSHGLQDQSDDVRAVAAEALLPLTEALAAKPPDGLQHILWDILLEVEELSPSTGHWTVLSYLLSSLLLTIRYVPCASLSLFC